MKICIHILSASFFQYHDEIPKDGTSFVLAGVQTPDPGGLNYVCKVYAEVKEQPTFESLLEKKKRKSHE